MPMYTITITPIHNRALPPTVLHCAGLGRAMVAMAKIAKTIVSTYDTGTDGVTFLPTGVDGETKLAITNSNGEEETILIVLVEETPAEESYNGEPA